MIPPVVEPYGSLRYRTINVDGDPGDWAGIQPIVTDDPFDGNNDREDIKAVYAANDGENLYFLMEIHHLNFASSDVDETSEGEYSFFIDIIPDSGHMDSGADYKIVHSITETPNPGQTQLTQLFSYMGSSWELVASCVGVQGNSSMYFIEVGVPWECIGGPACFNCYFSAHYEPPDNDSDYAPDRSDGVVLLGCCPGYLPVGGVIMPSTLLSYVITAILLFVAVMLLRTNTKFPSSFFLN
jgi:hypothetical protein